MKLFLYRHKSPADYWKVATPETLKAEIVGQRDIIVKFASINETSIKGYRAPFLQTSGEGTFKVTKPKYLNQYNFSLLINLIFAVSRR